MERVPPPRAGRGVLTRSHLVAIGAAVLVLSTVAVIAFVLSRSDHPGPPDGTYRLVARDSALCLTAPTGATPSDTTTPAEPPPAVRLSTCPDAGGAWGAAATAPAVVSGRGPGLGDSDLDGEDDLDGTGDLDGDATDGRWSVDSADEARIAVHPADGTDRCLAVTGRSSSSPVTVQPCRTTGGQTWSLRQVGRSNYFQVVADQGRRCLDAITVDGAVVAVENMCSSEPSQQWRFDPVG